MDEFSKVLDSNHGCLSSEIEDGFQLKLKGVLGKHKKIDSWRDYFMALGKKIPEGEEGDKVIYERLIQAVKNSRRKEYHADTDA